MTERNEAHQEEDLAQRVLPRLDGEPDRKYIERFAKELDRTRSLVRLLQRDLHNVHELAHRSVQRSIDRPEP